MAARKKKDKLSPVMKEIVKAVSKATGVSQKQLLENIPFIGMIVSKSIEVREMVATISVDIRVPVSHMYGHSEGARAYKELRCLDMVEIKRLGE